MQIFSRASGTNYAVPAAREQEKWTSLFVALAVVILLLAMPGLAHAQAINLPWDSGSCKLAKAFTGPWLGWMAVVAIAIAGLCFGIGEAKAPLQTVMRIAAGFSTAVAAVAVAGWIMPSMSVSLQSMTC